MERDDYLDGIRSAWLGELYGEVFFKALADRATDESMRSTWQTLATLEAVTGKKLASLLEAHGATAVTDEVIEVSEEILSQFTNASHIESMTRMKGIVEKAVIRFDQLLAVAPESDVPTVQFLVHHELALQTFADREIAGDHAGALEEAKMLLKQSGLTANAP